MSNTRAQAESYAQAIMQAMVERWQNTLAEADKLAKSELSELLRDSSASVDKKVDAFRKALPADAPVEAVNLLGMLIENDDIGMIEEVSGLLAEVATGQQAPQKADITSAIALSDDEKTQLRQKLTKDYGEGLIFNFSVDESLMAGLKVRVGDRLIDNSVASRLATLRETLSSAVR